MLFCVLRAFLKYLHDSEITEENFSQKVVSVPWIHQTAYLSSTLTIEQIESALNCVYHESPMGKRTLCTSALVLKVRTAGKRYPESEIRRYQLGDP